jgi:uncharacterized protein YuzE
MRIIYNKETDVLNIGFREEVVATKKLAENLVADYAQDGSLAGFKIGNASKNVEMNRITLESFLFGI